MPCSSVDRGLEPKAAVESAQGQFSFELCGCPSSMQTAQWRDFQIPLPARFPPSAEDCPIGVGCDPACNRRINGFLFPPVGYLMPQDDHFQSAPSDLSGNQIHPHKPRGFGLNRHNDWLLPKRDFDSRLGLHGQGGCRQQAGCIRVRTIHCWLGSIR
jgi:hypothetical protein